MQSAAQWLVAGYRHDRLVGIRRGTRHLTLAPVLSFLVACGGGGGGGGSATIDRPIAAPPAAADCGVESQKQFVLEVAQDWYRWYDEMAVADPADFETAEALLDALTAPLAEDFRDPGFSYLTTVVEDEVALGTGAYVGFGFRFAVDDSGRYLISDVFEDGTAFDAGFVRGAEILAVDRGDGYQSMREFEEQEVGLDEVFGAADVGIERGFRLRIDDETVERVIAKTELPIAPLAAAPRRVERPGLPPVGYLHLRSFTSSASAELLDAFADFATTDVTDFIIDLRYNSGGLVDVAERLLDLLGGRLATGEVAYQVSHNDKRIDEDFEARFNARTSSAAPLRIAFITSDATASASELVINSLAPHVELVLVGGDTLGKAVGSYAFDQVGCDTRLRLIAFEIFNGVGLGGYYTGLVDTGRFTLCAAEDQYTGAFGTAQESLVGAALGWLNEGVCGAVTASAGDPRSAGLRREPLPMQSSRPQPRERPDRRSFWVR